MPLFPTLVISMFITISLIPLCRWGAHRFHAMDMPEERKVHASPMPRTGGIAMIVGALFTVLVWSQGNGFLRALMLGSGVIALAGMLDDFRGLGYRAKFASQITAALIVIFFGGVEISSLGMLLPNDMFLPGWIAVLLTVFVIVGITNAINLSDGLDGLAGGITLLSFMCIGFLAYQAENSVIAGVSAAMVGVIFGFLRFNTYPATVFMGDAGSQFLGFVAITLSVKLTQANACLSPILPLIILGFPVLDTLMVVLERIARGVSPFRPDKNHFHHKLMRLGLYHTEAVLVIYALQAFLITTAYIFRFYPDGFLLVFYSVFSASILGFFLVAGRKDWRLSHYETIDRGLKGRLKTLKNRGMLMVVLFRPVVIGLPLLLIFSCLFTSGVPAYYSILSGSLMGLLLLLWLLKREWFSATLEVSLYLLIPFVVYMSMENSAPWVTEQTVWLYNLVLATMVLFVILTLKFTRRRAGFKVSTMDFLILFIAIALPNLPGGLIKTYHLGPLIAKIMAMLFCYEVLMGELREDRRWLGVTTFAALLIISVKGFL